MIGALVLRVAVGMTRTDVKCILGLKRWGEDQRGIQDGGQVSPCGTRRLGGLAEMGTQEGEEECEVEARSGVPVQVGSIFAFEMTGELPCLRLFVDRVLVSLHWKLSVWRVGGAWQTHPVPPWA